MKSFRPTLNATSNIDVSASSQRVKVANTSAEVQVRILNAGTATVWITAGDVTITADTANDFPVLAGMAEVMTFLAPDASPLYIAAIAVGSTGKIYFTPGTGI